MNCVFVPSNDDPKAEMHTMESIQMSEIRNHTLNSHYDLIFVFRSCFLNIFDTFLQARLGHQNCTILRLCLAAKPAMLRTVTTKNVECSDA